MRRVRTLLVSASLALALGACATLPTASDPHATAAEVFQLSGGLDDLKVMARFAPSFMGDVDVHQKCLDRLGRNPNILGVNACDMLESITRGIRSGEGGLSQALESQIDRMETHAVDVMAETYTPAELDAMKRYYASPEGRSIVAKRGEYLRRLFGAAK